MKLAARGITSEEVQQLRFNGPHLARSPHPRLEERRLLIGPTDGGRLITVVLEPDAHDRAVWHVMTGWPSSRREIRFFRSHPWRSTMHGMDFVDDIGPDDSMDLSGERVDLSHVRVVLEVTAPLGQEDFATLERLASERGQDPGRLAGELLAQAVRARR